METILVRDRKTKKIKGKSTIDRVIGYFSKDFYTQSYLKHLILNGYKISSDYFIYELLAP